jgi:flagellar hook-associated protein 1 FlgK
LGDPSKLVVYGTSPPTAAGDPTRPAFIARQLTSAGLTFAAETGIGTATAPFQGSLRTFLSQVISQQGQASAEANNLKQGQDVVVNALQQRVSEASGVNIDEEMAHLLRLQSAYGANARVLSAVKEMLDMLARI